MDDDDDLFRDIGAYRWNDSDTSKDAAESVDVNRLEGIVMDTLARHPDGLTSEEIAVKNGIALGSITPRMAPLKRKGKVIRTEEKRPGVSGSQRYVWNLAPPKEDTKAATANTNPTLGSESTYDDER